MKLRNQVLLAIGVPTLLLYLLTIGGSQLFLHDTFGHLEQQQVTRNVQRAEAAIQQNIDSLQTFTADWGHWDDAHDYLLNKNPNFVHKNLNVTAFLNSNINFLIYFDQHGQRKVAMAVDTSKKQAIPFQQSQYGHYLDSASVLLSTATINKDVNGLIKTPSGVMMVAASAVTNGPKTEPGVGTLVTGRYLSPALTKKLSTMTKLEIMLFLPETMSHNARLQQIYHNMMTHPGIVIHPINHASISGYTLLRDINGAPIGMLKIEQPRSVYQIGHQAITYYLLMMLTLLLMIAGLLWWLMKRLVVARLERLNTEVIAISREHHLVRRVSVTGRDELALVATQVNQMLTTIQAAQDVLEQRVDERTKELQDEIIERKNVEQELMHRKEELIRLAHYDSLTHLPNRVLFNEILSKAISQSQRQAKQLGILFIDLDRFKNINDSLGHSFGDIVLQEMSKRFLSALREEDVLARLGGDEFIVLVQELHSPKSAGTVAEKLLRVCTTPVTLENQDFYLSASIGISTFPADGVSLQDLQKNADMAMYQAKRSGGGIFHFYSKEMDEAVQNALHLEAHLRRALEKDEFILHYQPKINLQSEQMVSVEALVRWDSPELGLMNPAHFIPVAEETGLILAIGEWVLMEACRTNRQWQEQGFTPITVAVNLSPRQFSNHNIVETIKNILKVTNMDPCYLELEITESTIIDNLETSIQKLRQLQDMGIQITIDDFGTGYSSISYLKILPVNVLKIDQSFIRQIPDDQNDMAITASIISLAHSLNLKVVAEGIETKEQKEFLVNQRCDFGQGYYFSRPVPAQKIAFEFMEANVSQE
jgi:diguanylate cyclase (GGDEF)-like protein